MNDTETIWREYHTSLRDFIRRRVASPAEAEDILQDVFLKIHERLSTVRQPGRIAGWVYRIARNAIVDHYRAQKPMEPLPEGMPEAAVTEGRRTLQELSRCMRHMIDRLPEPYREAIVLSEIDGLTQREVAARQGISLSGAKSRVQRGRARLKEMLLDCCRFDFDRRGGVMDFEQRQPGCDKC